MSDGGVEVALREAAEWSGVAAPISSLEGVGVIVACPEVPDWPDAVELGVAG